MKDKLLSAVLILMLLVPAAAFSDISTRIVGGSEADEGAYTFMVALTFVGYEPYYGHYCGGTLVDENWVITAAHCVTDDLGNTVSTSSIQVILGIQDLQKDMDYETYDISRIIVHPGYDSRTIDSDIALIELEESVSSEFSPISPVDYGSDYTGEMVVTMGWGALEETGRFPEDYPAALMEVSLPVIDHDVCEDAMQRVGNITDTMICAGYEEGGKDACSGDSGGPLIVYEDDQWNLMGIVSWGEGCARANYYGVYTNVASFSSFITQYVNTEDTTSNDDTASNDYTETDYEKGYSAAVESCQADPSACGITLTAGEQSDGTWLAILPDPDTVTDDNYWSKVADVIDVFNEWYSAVP